MAAPNQQKAELLAIYRLEFYRKQKNWKLSTDTRKEKVLRNSCPTTPAKNSTILNETYSIDTNVDNVSVLNEAFLKDESDKDAPVSPTTNTTLHTQWLQPINACQECQHTRIKPQNPWSDYVDDVIIGSDVVDKGSGDGIEFEGFDGWVEGMVWTNSSIPQSLWTGDMPDQHQQGVQHQEQPTWTADHVQYQHLDQLTPWPDDQTWLPDIWDEGELAVHSLRSEEEFMMGAHSAPHSSELELELCVAAEGAGGAAECPSRMSGAALSAAVRRHAGSLRRLLREAGRRRRCRSTLSLDACALDEFGLGPRDLFATEYSYEAFPTRDVAPAPPSAPAEHCQNNVTEQPGATPSDDGCTPPARYYCKDEVPPLSGADHCEDNFTLMQPGSCDSVLTPPPPGKVFRDGFLAGSHRNKVPLEFVGRGRGRLQAGGGAQA